MRKFLITGAGVLFLAVPALAQGVTTETTTTKQSTESLAPIPAPGIVSPSPLPGTPSVETHSTVTRSGEGGASRTDKSSDTYIGADGQVHKNQVIQHEEQH